MSLFHQLKDGGFSIEEIDKFTGPAIGRPKSATFRTADIAGIDTLCHVANGVYDNCINDESRDVFKLPDFLKTMLDKKMLGSKTNQGFYKKIKGKNLLLTFDDGFKSNFNVENFKYAECSTCTDKIGLDLSLIHI